METVTRVSADKRLRRSLLQQVNNGRMGMLVLLAVTLLNQLLLLFRVNYHFLFSAAAPYYLNWAARAADAHAAVKAIFVILTLAIYIAYAACWLLSGQDRRWLTAALGLYAMDTLLLIIFCLTMLTNPASCLFEILTHGAGLLLLYNTDRCARRLSKLPRRRRAPAQSAEQTAAPV